MQGPFLVRFGSSDDGEPSPHEVEQQRLRVRYRRYLLEQLRLDEPVVERVMNALFVHRAKDGRECVCGCHPRLSSTHDDGFDCSCTWDEERRARQRRDRDRWFDSPEAEKVRAAAQAERAAVARWVASQPGVQAEQTSSAAPERWEGTVDGHSFSFRERHGEWRIELDLEGTGRFVERLVRVEEGGNFVTEPVEITEGPVIAEGLEHELGRGPVEHLQFIVRRIREHLWRQQCEHAGALFYCPICGKQMDGPR